MNTEALITEARKYVKATPSDGVRRNIQIRAKNAGDLEDDITLACWTFLTHEPGTRNDYEAMLPHWKDQVKRTNPSAAWLVTRQPDGNMFHRAMSMCAHVHSSLFTVPTVFLDVDAFPNCDLAEMIGKVKDVGLTVRDMPGLMPVNEGVIIARPSEATKAFFMAYVATFEALQGFLSDADWRWFGGQLALNALHDSIVGPSVRYLPCAQYNFSPDTEADMEPAVLDTKTILHLKGPRKQLFERVKAYQNAR
jgi:hypothetical protein